MQDGGGSLLYMILLGDARTYGGYTRPLSIETDDLLYHTFILGATGTGKSSLTLNILTQLIAQGDGCLFLDPHGRAAHALLDRIPKRRSRDVIYLRPADLEYPIGLNPLAGIHPDKRHLVASNLVEALQNIYVNSWGPRLDWYLYNCVRTLLEIEEATPLWIPRLLTDWAWRRQLIRYLPPSISSFWSDEFEKKDNRLREEAISPIQNKVGRLTTSPPLRNILGQRRSAFDVLDVMESRKIVVADLSGLGRGEADLLGSILVTLFQVEAFNRESTYPFVIALDEAHRFSTKSLATVLSESRKYGLALLLVSQYLSQWDPSLKSSIFGNVGTLINFTLGGDDARYVANHLGGDWPSEAFSDLPKYSAIMSVMQAEPSLVKTLPMPLPRKKSDALIRQSRMRYAQRRHVIEAAIRRELE